MLIIFIGTEPLFCVLHFMEITWLLGPGIKVLKVGRAIPFSFLYHVTMTTSNIMCLRLINLFRFVGYMYVDCRVLKENTK